MFNKNLIIIFLSSTIASFAPVVTVLLSGIIGSQLTNTGWASTLGMSLMICGTFIFAPIASKIFSIIGRKKGFMTAPKGISQKDFLFSPLYYLHIR